MHNRNTGNSIQKPCIKFMNSSTTCNMVIQNQHLSTAYTCTNIG